MRLEVNEGRWAEDGEARVVVYGLLPISMISVSFDMIRRRLLGDWVSKSDGFVLLSFGVDKTEAT